MGNHASHGPPLLDRLPDELIGVCFFNEALDLPALLSLRACSARLWALLADRCTTLAAAQPVNLEAVCRVLPRLTDVRVVDLDDAGARAMQRLRCLRRLSAAASPRATDAALTRLPRPLQTIDLSQLPRATSAGVAALIQGRQRLRVLRLERFCQLDDAGLAGLGALVALEELSLRGCGRITDAALLPLAALPELRRVDLGLCSALTDATLVHALPAGQLEALSVAGCGLITDAGLDAIVRRQPALRKLNMSLVHGVSADALHAALEATPAVADLRLHCCPLRRESVGRLGGGATEVLGLAGCRLVDDAGVAQLAARLTALRRLNLSACPRVGDAALIAVAAHLAQLEQVNVSNCMRVGDPGVIALAALPRLAVVKLFGCARVTSAAAHALALSLALVVLVAAGSALDDGGVRALLDSRPGLRLDVSGCPNVSPATRELIGARAISVAGKLRGALV